MFSGINYINISGSYNIISFIIPWDILLAQSFGSMLDISRSRQTMNYLDNLSLKPSLKSNNMKR